MVKVGVVKKRDSGVTQIIRVKTDNILWNAHHVIIALADNRNTSQATNHAATVNTQWPAYCVNKCLWTANRVYIQHTEQYQRFNVRIQRNR